MSPHISRAPLFIAGLFFAGLTGAQAGPLIRPPLSVTGEDGSLVTPVQVVCYDRGCYPVARVRRGGDWERERERRAEERRRYEEAEMEYKRARKAANWKRRAEEAERRAAALERRYYGPRSYGYGY